MVGVGVYAPSPSPCSNLQREIILQSVQGGEGVVGVGRCCGLECVLHLHVSIQIHKK